MLGYGGDHGGLAGAWGAEQQVASLPCPADPGVVVLPLLEGVEVIDDGLLVRGVHGKRSKRGRVLERHGAPESPLPSPRDVGEEAVLAVLGDDGAALFNDLGQVGLEDGADRRFSSAGLQMMIWDFGIGYSV